MAGENVDIVRKCSVCGTEIETISVKKENVMLSSRATVYCPKCKAERPEIRDVAGRIESIEKEAETYPKQTGSSASLQSATHLEA